MDYAIPRAEDLPFFVTDQTVTVSPFNPLGAKGIGEAATIGSTPALVNAVVDALKPFGVRHLDMPLRPERVWRAVENRGPPPPPGAPRRPRPFPRPTPPPPPPR